LDIINLQIVIIFLGIVSKRYAIPKVISNTNINKNIKYYIKNITHITQPNKKETIFYDDIISVTIILIGFLVAVFSLPIILYIYKK